MRIIYIQYTNPAAYPPLEHSSRILADTGWNVLFLGAGALGAGPLRFPPHSGISVRQLAFCPAGFRQKLHYAIYCLWVLAWVVRWRPRWIYASDLLACPIGLLLTFVPGLRVVYHEHDSPNQSHKGAARWMLSSRRMLAKRSARCILPNEARARRFQAATGQSDTRVLCVWNCPRTEEIAEAKPPVEDGRLRLLYHGSIVPDRLPLSVLAALASLPDQVTLRVVGYETLGSVGYRGAILDKARELGIGHRVEIRGPVSRFELVQQARECDIGLALVPSGSSDATDADLGAMTGASNKPFDYLACGLALLVSNLHDWTAMFVEPGYARACDPDDSRSIDSAIRWFIEHPRELRAMGESGRRRIAERWNYETEFAKVQQVLHPMTDPCGATKRVAARVQQQARSGR